MTFQFSSRRAMSIGGFAIVIAAIPAVAAVVPGVNAPTSVAECPAGYTLEPTSGACVTGGDQSVPEALPGNSGLPQVDGIPCTGANSGQCIGLEESQGGDGPVIP